MLGKKAPAGAHPGAQGLESPRFMYSSHKNEDSLFLIRYLSTNNEINPYFKGLFNGGENGIRTHERESSLHAFQACAFNHSATSP